MKRQNRQQKYNILRKQFPVFTFSDYTFSIERNGLKAEFLFSLSDTFEFRPTFFIPSRPFLRFTSLDKTALDNFVFHIGMIEMISYWKATCSPVIRITVHRLNEEQIEWWKKLYFNGLGEFFYLNGLTPEWDNFIYIQTKGNRFYPNKIPLDENIIIVPIGGGKDSAVTLEILKQIKGKTLIPFVLNPREASMRTIEVAGFTQEETLVVKRTLDTQLIELNRQGFLNGHTPFSALLAFTASFTATLAGAKYVALSNESSANESTVPGSNINHQYSKSFEFEKDFFNYFTKFVQSNVHYFSFLRPLNELQIASLFAKLKQHHSSIRSCNVGSKTDCWCGTCPKCLFTAIILSPFLSAPELKDIFHKEMFEDISIRPVYEELTGKAKSKPFECVGTPSEVNAALWHTFSKRAKKPALLKDFAFKEKKKYSTDFESLLQTINSEHNLPEDLFNILKAYLHA